MNHRLAFVFALALVSTFVVAFSETASAHGRFPEIVAIDSHPSSPDRLAVYATFGALISDDGGATFHWMCREVMNVSLTENPVHLLLSDGVSVASFDGLIRSDDSLCEWSYPTAELERVVVIDQTRDPNDPSTILALTSSGGVDNGVFRSTDEARSFEPAGPPIEPELFEKIRIAPSDSSIVYLSGSYPASEDEPRRAFVHRSSDGGASFTRVPFELREGERNIHLLGVDPTDPDRVYMRVLHSADFDDKLDRLVVSSDGGMTFEDRVEVSQLRGFAISADGATVWVGGRGEVPMVLPDGGLPDASVDPGAVGGLWRSDDGGETFENIRSDLRVGCLSRRAGELWVCADNYLDGFAIGRSADEGVTFEPVMSLDEIAGQITCDAEGDYTAACRVAYTDLVRDLMLVDDAGIADAGVDGGVGGGGGCDCHVASGRSSSGIGAFLVLLLVAFRRAR